MSSCTVVPNSITLGAAISATVQLGKWREASCLYSMLAASEVPTVIACNSMLAALESSSQWQRSLSFLHCLADSLVQADTITYSVVLSACQKSLQWQHVLEVVQLLPAQCALDTRVYASAFDACAMSAQAKDAVRLLEALAHVVRF